MSFRLHAFIMAGGSLLAWLAWLYVVVKFDPLKAGRPGHWLFYFSLGLALLGTFMILGALIRRRFSSSDTPLFREVRVAFRHAFLAAALITLLLILQGARWLKWWSGALILILGFLIEAWWRLPRSASKHL